MEAGHSHAGGAKDVCIIGAGISGLVSAKSLQEKGIDFDCFEKGSNVGGMWRYENDNGMSSAYRSLHIDTSRKSLSYPDFPVPEDKPDYLSHWEMLRHIEAYADHFGVRQRITFNTEVTDVAPEEDGLWRVRLDSGDSRRYKSVIVANGHLWDPRYPDFPGTFDGETIHSHYYRTASPYDGKDVLVVGIGNSAVDIAIDLVRRANKVHVSTRRSAWIMPKYIMGIPTDRWLVFLTRRLRLPVPFARWLMGHIKVLALGRQERFGVPRPKHPIWREHTTLSQELLPYIGHGWVSVKPNVRELQDSRVLFDDGSAIKYDAIIFATGYRISFPFLAPSVFMVRDGEPPALYRRIVALDRPGLYFIGLVQPVGPTITLAEVQARWLSRLIAGEIRLPARREMAAEIEAHRRHVKRTFVGSSRYTLEVDFLPYVKQLNRDMRAAPA